MQDSGSAQSLEDFHEKIEELVIDQARRLINRNLYTEAVLSALPVAVIATDAERKVCASNDGAKRMFGSALSRAAALDELLVANPVVVECVTQCLSDGGPHDLASQKFAQQDGGEVVLNVHVRPLFDEERDICGSLVAFEDQTYVSFLQEAFAQYMPPPDPAPLVAESTPMQKVARQVAKLAESAEPVLITGERGTGKGFLAAKLHEARAAEGAGRFIVIDCAAQPNEDMSRFLFGASASPDGDGASLRLKSVGDYGAVHLVGGGTVLLRNIDSLPPDDQEAICDYLDGRADEEGETSAGVVLTLAAGSKQEIDAAALHPRLREQVAKRTITLPTLWRRKKDILPLAQQFLSEFDESPTLSQACENMILSSRYPNGNVAELREALRLAVVVAGGQEIEPEHIFTGPKQEELVEVDIGNVSIMRMLISDGVLRAVRYATVISFATMVVLALVASDHVSGHVANALAWGVGWPLLILSFFLVGRLWCSLCPLSTTSGLLAKFVKGKKRAPPAWLKTHSAWLIPLGFLLIVWAERVFEMTSHAFATGILLLSLMTIAVVFAALFERETLCRYVCPLGNLGAILSPAATLGVRANPNVCATQCTTHECNKGSEKYSGCPVFHHPLYVRDSHVCKLCFNCVKSCPHGSARLYLGAPLQRIWRLGEISRTVDTFSLTVFFAAPVLLAAVTFGEFHNPIVFTGALAVAFGAALAASAGQRRLFGSNDESDSLATRVSLALLVLSWGTFASFHLSNIPGIQDLRIRAASGPGLMPSGGIPVLAVLQAGAGLITLLAAWICLGVIARRAKERGSGISRSGWLYITGMVVVQVAGLVWLIAS